MVAVPEVFYAEAKSDIAEFCDAAGTDASLHVVIGGRDRVESVQAALKQREGAEVVLVHDAARCLTPPEVFARVAEAVAAGAPAVVPALPMVDTVRRVDAEGALRGDLDRSALRRIQTPQGFRADVLERAHEAYLAEVTRLGDRAREATDDAGLVERIGVDVIAVDGHEEALKITYPHDLVLAEHLAHRRDVRH